MASSSGIVVWTALAGNLLVAVTKFVAAAVTGSSAMLAEANHSLIDTVDEVLLLYGLRQARKKPDKDFPFGYGRELYFWSFVVAILIFMLGAGVTVWEGVRHLLAPEPLEKPAVIYVVLALSAVFEGISWFVSLRAFRAASGETGLWLALRRSKDPPKFLVLLEDTAALLGLAIAAAGVWLSVAFDEPRFDGLASILIGLLLAAVALVLARETKSLLIGERADPGMTKDVERMIDDFDGVDRMNGLLTAQLAPDQVIAIASVAFRDTLRVAELEALIERIETAVVERHPEIGRLFVKPQTPETYARAKKKLFEEGYAPEAAT